MQSFKIYLYYYIGHIIWLTCMRYWYIPKAHDMYSYCMNKSSELDTENILWSDVDKGGL